jgi:hypothetical protein
VVMGEALEEISEEMDWQHSVIQPVYYFRDKRRRDRDNYAAMLKASYDGIADATSVDDKEFIPLPCVMGVDKEDPRVELIVTAESISVE